MKKTLALIESMAKNDIEIKDILSRFHSKKIDEDTLFSSIMLTLCSKKAVKENDSDDIDLDMMTW